MFTQFQIEFVQGVAIGLDPFAQMFLLDFVATAAAIQYQLIPQLIEQMKCYQKIMSGVICRRRGRPVYLDMLMTENTSQNV